MLHNTFSPQGCTIYRDVEQQLQGSELPKSYGRTYVNDQQRPNSYNNQLRATASASHALTAGVTMHRPLRAPCLHADSLQRHAFL